MIVFIYIILSLDFIFIILYISVLLLIGNNARIARSSAVEVAAFTESAVHLISTLWTCVTAIQICWLSDVT